MSPTYKEALRASAKKKKKQLVFSVTDQGDDDSITCTGNDYMTLYE